MKANKPVSPATSKFPIAPKTGKHPTMNYPPDKHKVFCKRCFTHNHGCPSNKKHPEIPNPLCDL